jgi:hypothetical protein
LEERVTSPPSPSPSPAPTWISSPLSRKEKEKSEDGRDIYLYEEEGWERRENWEIRETKRTELGLTFPRIPTHRDGSDLVGVRRRDNYYISTQLTKKILEVLPFVPFEEIPTSDRLNNVSRTRNLPVLFLIILLFFSLLFSLLWVSPSLASSFLCSSNCVLILSLSFTVQKWRLTKMTIKSSFYHQNHDLFVHC